MSPGEAAPVVESTTTIGIAAQMATARMSINGVIPIPETIALERPQEFQKFGCIAEVWSLAAASRVFQDSLTLACGLRG